MGLACTSVVGSHPSVRILKSILELRQLSTHREFHVAIFPVLLQLWHERIGNVKYDRLEGREEGREGGREGGRKRGREEEREGGREGGRKTEKEIGRERERRERKRWKE